MKCLLATVLLIYMLPQIMPYVQKKVKIFVPTRVEHIHHTKVVKIPEYHHYFHDRKQSHPKYAEFKHSEFKHPEFNVPNEFRDFDEPQDERDASNADDQFLQVNGYSNAYDFETSFPDQSAPHHFDDRNIAMSVMPPRAKAVKSSFQYSMPHHSHHLAYNMPKHYRKHVFNEDRYHPQHFYHHLGNHGMNHGQDIWL